MAYKTLISSEELYQNLDQKDWVILDCRFSLGDTEKGREAYLASHIPGARYAHLDDDLSGLIHPGQTGRHPLPDLDQFVNTLRNWGIDQDTQVISYDDMGGPFAARLWWMLQWVGHEKAAVLNGGFPSWMQKGYTTDSAIPKTTPTQYSPALSANRTFSAEDLLHILDTPEVVLVDARAEQRFAGIHEPIDPIAGHIPGALSFPFKGNLTEDGHFKSREELKERYSSLSNLPENSQIVCYCGSGVTAAHNILAMVHAGLSFPRMYPGSWSEWITDHTRPISKRVDN